MYRKIRNRLRYKTERSNGTYDDPSELEIETRLAERTSCDRVKVVVAGPERLRRAPPPSWRDGRAAHHTHIQYRRHTGCYTIHITYTQQDALYTSAPIHHMRHLMSRHGAYAIE